MSTPHVEVNITADLSSFKRAVAAAARSTHRFSLAFMSKRTKRRHVPRCDMCSPMANPRPLSIDGHAYRRRRNARRRRA